MTTERDFTTAENKLAKAVLAVRDAEESLNLAIRGIRNDGSTVRNIDQFTAREACTVLAALRLLQTIQCQGGELPREMKILPSRSDSSAASRLSDMEHFETEAPLSVTELDDLCERIEVDFNR